MFDRTASPHDGEWTPIRPSEGASAILFSTKLHPQPIKRDAYVVVVAIDLARAKLGLVAGTEEPLAPEIPIETRGATVPEAAWPELIAVWNGGFKARHGAHGALIAGTPYVPPIDDACTIAIDAEGRVAIASWPKLASRAATFTSYRQTPPCLVEGGALNPGLPGELRDRKWGAAENGDRAIRRSALGLSADGATLFYGFGDWTLAADVAAAMLRAGAVDVAELDVNWSYPRFFWFAPGTSPPRIEGTFIPKIKHSPESYVTRRSERDFFYLTRRR